MKVFRIVLALMVTVAMLYIARSNSRGRPEIETGTDNGYTFDMTTVPKITEYESGQVAVMVSGPFEAAQQVMFRTSQPDNLAADQSDQFAALAMTVNNSVPDEFLIDVTAGEKAGRFHYYFQVVDSAGATLATFTGKEGTPFFLRYIGEVPPLVLGAHIFFIFATVFCIAMALVYSVGVIAGTGDIKAMARWLMGATFCAFMGSYPFGIPMNWYAFGGTWEGVPFGTDATDNKSQLLFVYLLLAAFAALGSMTGGRRGRDIFSPRTLGWLGAGSFAVMLFIYLIPHSIQFSAGFTNTFCYAWIGLVLLVYMIGQLRSRQVA